MRYLSFSQMQTFESCQRRWFFERVYKLYVPFDRKSLGFGTALHSVAERYLKGDDTGRDADGNPVVLYPEGWHIIEEKGSRQVLSKDEQAHIRWLIDAAIHDGVLFRIEDAQIERNFTLPLTDDALLTGKIDYSAPGVVRDHKTYGKNSGKYLLKSDRNHDRYIGEDKQLLTYAAVQQALDDYDGDFKLAHQQFPSTAPSDGTRPTVAETTVSAERVREHMLWLVEMAKEMTAVASQEIKSWRKIPGPSDPSKCSRWYGKACAFAEVCAGMIDPDKFNDRKKPWDLKAASAALPSNTNTTPTMSLFKRTTSPATGQTPAATVATPAATVPTQPVAAGDAPPWADPKCPACKGTGILGKAGCPLCDKKAKAGTGCQSSNYAFKTDGKQVVSATALPAHMNALRSAGWPLEWASGVEAPAAPAAASEQTGWVDAETGEPEGTVAALGGGGGSTTGGQNGDATTPPPPHIKPIGASVATEGSVATEQAAEKPRRGRKPGSKNKPKAAPATTDGELEANVAAGEAEIAAGDTIPLAQLKAELATQPETETQESLSGWGSPAIFLGCWPDRGETIRVQELFTQLIPADYYSQNAFARRDKLRTRLDEAFALIADRSVVCIGASDPDTDAFLSALLGDSRVGLVVTGAA